MTGPASSDPVRQWFIAGHTRFGIIPIPGCITLPSGCPDLSPVPDPQPAPQPVPQAVPPPAPVVTPPLVSNRRAVQSTRSDATWVAHRDAQSVWDRLALPRISIGARPEHGYVNIESLFWVAPDTYAGQRLVAGDTLAVPWTLSWDEDVTTTTTAPCPDDPDQMCTSSETHTFHREQPYTDTYEVEVQAIPARYAWDFGDGRPESAQVFDPDAGLGIPYTEWGPESSVAYRYEWSSLDHLAEGGFRIQLDVSWAAAERWHMSSTFGDSQDGGGPLSPRRGHYETRHQVREVRSVIKQ